MYCTSCHRFCQKNFENTNNEIVYPAWPTSDLNVGEIDDTNRDVITRLVSKAHLRMYAKSVHSVTLRTRQTNFP